MNTQKEATIIIPSFNEEKGIRTVLESMKKFSSKFEIIVVDDGSKDATSRIVNKFPGVKLIRHDVNKGYGAAIKTGVRQASSNIIIITDADATYPSQRIPDLLKKYREGNIDMVVGARTGENVKIPLIRKPAKWFIKKLADYLSGENIIDINSGLRLIRKDLISKFNRILPEGFSFTMTITLALLTNGYRVEYIPIDYHKREGKSKLRPLRDTYGFLKLIVRTVLYFQPLKVFMPLSFLFFIVGFILLLYRIFITEAFVTTITLLFMAAFQLFIVGLLADLIDKRMKD
ncbi:MAG: glycosyltransferase family 2 protein [Candidatus Aminicenantes bacterium]|nr:glycosyltransferase family 2 protein [Candidatus Aminicenantes bacterium]